jgi:predicted transcriptional regulator
LSAGNLNRIRTKKVVTLFPGIHLRKLQRVMNTSFNTTRYHVRNLEKAGEIVCSEEGGLKRLYPTGFDERAKVLQAVLLDRTTRRILEALLETGPMGNADISSATEFAKSTVSEHVDVLRKADILRKEVSLDGIVSYEIRDRDRVAAVMATFKRSILTSATDNFIDLWDL